MTQRAETFTGRNDTKVWIKAKYVLTYTEKLRN